MEVKVFIDVFKLCTFSTDQIKEFVGEVYLCIVGGDMDTGKGRKKQSQGNRKKYTTGYQNLQNNKEKAVSININYTSITKTRVKTKSSTLSMVSTDHFRYSSEHSPST